MKFNTIIRLNSSTEDGDAKRLIVNIANENRYQNLKKGIRLIKGNVTLGLNGTDYIEDKYTVRISFDAYKVPRIISRHLLGFK